MNTKAQATLPDVTLQPFWFKTFFFFFSQVKAGLLIALKITLINFAIFKNKLYNLFYSFFAQSKFWKQVYKDKFLWGHQNDNGMLLFKK